MITLAPEIPDTGRPLEMSARGRETKLGHKVAGSEAPSEIEDKLDTIHLGTIRAFNPGSVGVGTAQESEVAVYTWPPQYLFQETGKGGSAHGSNKGRARLPLGNRDG